MIAVAAVGVAACGAADFPEASPAPEARASVEAIIYLIGDAGLATPEMPIIAQLKAEVAERSRETEVVVAFLGDNIYEHGLHEESHPDRAKDVGYLEAQIGVVRGTTAKGVFVPGNHDWGYGGERGIGQIRRQGEYLAEAASEVDVALQPPAVCPGPTTSMSSSCTSRRLPFERPESVVGWQTSTICTGRSRAQRCIAFTARHAAA